MKLAEHAQAAAGRRRVTVEVEAEAPAAAPPTPHTSHAEPGTSHAIPGTPLPPGARFYDPDEEREPRAAEAEDSELGTPRESRTSTKSASSSSSSSSSSSARRPKEGEEEVHEPRRKAPRLSALRSGDTEKRVYAELEELSRTSMRYAGEPARTRYDACEIFSQPRLTARARERGMQGGWALDLHFEDPVSGRKWDMANPKEVARAREMIRRTQPRLIMFSPPCTAFSTLQGLRNGPSREEWDAAVKLFSVAVDLCCYQSRRGGLFAFEHPHSSSAWNLPVVARLASLPGVCSSVLHMCQYNLRAVDEFGEGFAMKPTRVITNSSAIGEAICRKCSGGHRHVALINGRARKAGHYTPEFCDSILEGLKLEMQ